MIKEKRLNYALFWRETALQAYFRPIRPNLNAKKAKLVMSRETIYKNVWEEIAVWRIDIVKLV